MDLDRVVVGVHADQQRGDRGAAAEAILDRGAECRQAVERGLGGLPVVAAVGRAAFVLRVRAAEVIHRDFQVTRAGVRQRRQALAEAAQLGLGPLLHVQFHVEHGAGVGLAAHRLERQAQHELQQALEAAVGAGADVHFVEAALDEEALHGFGVVAAVPARGEFARQRVVGLQHAVAVERAHVEGGHPGVVQHVCRQFEAEALACDLLRALLEACLMLLRGDFLQRRHDGIEARTHGALILGQFRIARGVDQRMGLRRTHTAHALAATFLHAGGAEARALRPARQPARSRRGTHRHTGRSGLASAHRFETLTGVHAGSSLLTAQPRAPPDTVIAAPALELPLLPVMRLAVGAGAGVSSVAEGACAHPVAARIATQGRVATARRAFGAGHAITAVPGVAGDAALALLRR